MKILLDKTDEENTLTVPQMIEELARFGISAERKSIYDDLEYLKLMMQKQMQEEVRSEQVTVQRRLEHIISHRDV